VYIIPRQNQVRNASAVLHGLPLKFAALEICGLVLARSAGQFKDLTAGHINKEMATNVSLGGTDLEDVVDAVGKSFSKLS